MVLTGCQTAAVYAAAFLRTGRSACAKRINNSDFLIARSYRDFAARIKHRNSTRAGPQQSRRDILFAATIKQRYFLIIIEYVRAQRFYDEAWCLS